MTFKNKVVIITGSSAGIGAATAILFSKEGAHVVIVGRNEANLKKVAEKCNKSLIVKADVTKEPKKIIDETVKKFGKIDVLVNNAGILSYGSISKGNFMEGYDKTMAINIRAVTELTMLATPYLIKTKGNIVNVSSVVSKIVPTIPEFLPYHISKAALDMFTRGVALELSEKGVRVNSVSPGPVKTDFLKNSSYQVEWGVLSDPTALHRAATPEEIGDMILYLASDRAKSITGSLVVVDNGMLLKNN